MKRYLPFTLLSLFISLSTLAAYHFSGMGMRNTAVADPSVDSIAVKAYHSPAPSVLAPSGDVPVDFHFAAEKTMPAVVHVISIRQVQYSQQDPFYDFFGHRPRAQGSRQSVSSGSGVIISEEGYIVTNNHVIKDADELKVSLYDGRTFTAKVIGSDPSTDLGLIKIEGENFTPIEFANSDDAKVGEWVLAVGNPFNLASTATAGIVSAIGRDLEIIKDRMAIESFIQTDAAVNPGNSGGALVNLKGKLIGVNTAIASPTGTFAGYAFAVPANLVWKVVADLKEYGSLQRAFLGLVEVETVNADIATEKGLSINEGLLVNALADLGGARRAGMKEGDIIRSFNGVQIRSQSKLLEMISRNRPGDEVNIVVNRHGRNQTLAVVLTNQEGSTEILGSERNELLNDLGIEFRNLSERERSSIGRDYGVMVTRLFAGKVRQETGMMENFVILKMDGAPVKSVSELIQFLEANKGKLVRFEGFYPNYYGRLRMTSYDLRI